MAGGIAGFPKREESSYDAFGTGHSSTSISAALGMAVAAKRQGWIGAWYVIGDGAPYRRRVRGFEQCAMDANLLVILNDNEMSISPMGGA